MNNKKIIALVLAFAMMFSSITTVFADTTATIGADAAALKAIGVLQGDDGGVTPTYLAKETTRMQAAIMFLRLKGLEDEAKAFKGTANFADANTMTWNEGKAMMAYLKANPQLGWVGGDGGKFEPFASITVNQYYKVMLEALGYKQTSAAVVGDFTWAEVMTFAASKGLVKVAGAAKFTNNDVAIATIEALKTDVKGTTTDLATSMVDAGMINKAAAVAAGLYEEAATTAAEVKAVKAIANNKVEVEFTAGVTKAFAEFTGNYKIVVKGSTTALEVKAAVAESATKVVVETAAQTAGTAYTMTVGTKSINFAGLAKDAAAPTVKSVKAVDTNTVEVEFDKVMDSASATNTANYTVNNNVTVKSAVLSADRKTVTLTTAGVVANKVYTLKIENVKSSDLVAVKTVSKSFTGKADTKAPVLKSLTVANNVRLIVSFTDDHGVNKASAENLANYTIVSGNDTLQIKSIVAKDSNENDDIDYDKVEITTETQVSGKAYTLKINNLVDGSVSANVITKEISKDFRGKAADTTAPKVSGTPYGTTDTKFFVAFDELNRLDAATATNVDNYTFNNDIVVQKAEIVDAEDLDSADGKTVMLTVSAMDANKYYKLTIANVADEFGNAMATVTKNVKGVAEDVIPPYVKSVRAVGNTQIKITFDGKLDKASAIDPTNYVLDNNVGAALKASLSDDKLTVTLTTPQLTANKSYKITMNNIKDMNGNALANVKAYVVVGLAEIDTTRPEVVAIDAPYTNVLRITFDEAVVASGTPQVTVTSTAGTQTFSMVGNLYEGGTVAEFTADGFTMVDGREYTITAISGITDKHNNKYVAPTNAADQDKFDGTTLFNPGPEVDSWEQVDVKTIRVFFNEPVSRKAATYQTAAVAGDVTAQETFSVTVDPDADRDDEGYSVVDFVITSRSIITDAKAFGFNFSAIIEDYAGADAVDVDDVVSDSTGLITTDRYTLIESYVSDEDAAVIETVAAVNKNTIEVTYNENVSTTGSYKITDSTGRAVAQSGNPTKDDNVVTIKLTSSMKADEVYTLIPVTGAKDIAGNTSSIKDVEFTFVGSIIDSADYVKGVKVIDAKTIKVATSSTVANGMGFEYTVEKVNADSTLTTIAQADADGTAELQIALGAPVLDGVTYKVTVAGFGTYEFKGIATNGGLEILTGDVVEFSGWDINNYVVKVVYNGNSYTVLPSANVFDATIAFGTTDGNAANGVELDIQPNTVYYVEVYRTTSDLNGNNTTTDYDNANEGTVIYAQEFTK